MASATGKTTPSPKNQLRSSPPLPARRTLPGSSSTPLVLPSPKNWNVPNEVQIRNSPIRKPQSPTRLTMNAFFPADAADGRVNQKPISKYEQSPTSSQPTNISRKLLASTSTSMEKVNRFR